jgi:uncharacterized protein YuzE
MKVNYDKESDILYIVLKKGPAYDSEELNEDIRVEFDKEGEIIGIEVFDASRNVGKAMAEEIAQYVKAITK